MRTQARARLAGALRWGGWGVVLSGSFLRASVGIETLPHWDTDPTRMVLPLTGLTPAGSQAVDIAIMTGAGLALMGEALAGLRVSIVWMLLVLAGATGVGLHAAVLDGGSLEHARIGSTWIAAMVAGLAGMHLCRDDRVRRVTVAGATGLLMMLAAKGVLQITVEHAATVAQYRADPDAFLASQGWAKGSISARNFERRLLQPEATGWFGLANVYASFAAAGLVGLTGWTLLAWRQTRDEKRALPDGWAGVLSLGAISAAVALALAGSKGGATAAAIGLALLAGRMLLIRGDGQPASLAASVGGWAAIWMGGVGLPATAVAATRALTAPRGRPTPWLTERAGGLLAWWLVLTTIAAVVLRGAIGTRMGELSLLFRWFYMQGATRIFAARPGLGVGPGGFKDAYMLFKPKLSPEEVQSPHSVLFDFGATLGVLGLAWAAVWMGWVFGLGRRVVDRDSAPGPEGNAKLESWFVGLTAVAPSLAAMWVERAVATPDAAIARMVGLLSWIGVGVGFLGLARRTGAWRWIAALGALVIAVHGQIEVTPVWGGSACVVMIMLAASGAPRSAERGRGWLPWLCVLGLAGAWGSVVLPPVVRWEGALAEAADRLSGYALLSSRAEEARDPRAKPQESMQQIAADLGRALGSPPVTDDAGFGREMDRLLARCSAAAAGDLARAMAAEPRHLPTVEAYCRMRLSEGAAKVRLVDPTATAALDEAGAAAQRQCESPSAGAFGLLGNVWSTRADVLREPDLMNRAVDAWARAAALDPFGLSFPLRVFRAERTLGHLEAARLWAGRLLELDSLQRLDELKRLTPAERQEVEGALRSP